MARLLSWTASNAWLLLTTGVAIHLIGSLLVRRYVRKAHPNFGKITNPELRRFLWRTSGERGVTPTWVLLVVNFAMALYVVGAVGLLVRIFR